MLNALTGILFFIGLIGFAVMTIRMIINHIRKMDNKKNKKLLFGFLGVMFVSIFISALLPNSSNELSASKSANISSNDEKLLTASDKKLLKKNYSQFNGYERTQFSEIEDKYKKMKEKDKKNIKSDYERLLKEKEVQIKKWEEEEKKKEQQKKEEEKKKKEEFIKKNTKTLSAGQYTVGEHLDEGQYMITFNGSGNLFVYGSDGQSVVNEIGGSDLGISQYKVTLVNGWKIKISSMSINIKPIESQLRSYSNFELHAGYWIVGQDVTAGRYKASVDSGSGNFFVYDENGAPKTNEILGSDLGVKEVIIDLEDGDLINISSLNHVKFSPEE
ncbi:hypothetical protein [Clostridium oceanicum]|uniref:Uncharacterized protein n=1 Tax=Clostridium oceanicum TaxID=1543 RepID=A0ABP3UI71_9CLOT